jgi:hypothetical protein
MPLPYRSMLRYIHATPDTTKAGNILSIFSGEYEMFMCVLYDMLGLGN